MEFVTVNLYKMTCWLCSTSNPQLQYKRRPAALKIKVGHSLVHWDDVTNANMMVHDERRH